MCRKAIIKVKNTLNKKIIDGYKIVQYKTSTTVEYTQPHNFWLGGDKH